MHRFVRKFPPSVEITTSQWAPVVTINDTIWIEHWNYFEDKVFPKKFGFLVIRICKKFQNTSHHPRCYCLTRVHPGWNDNCLFLLKFLYVTLFCNCKYFTINSRKWLTQFFPCADGSAGRFAFNCVQVGQQVTIWIRITICEVNRIIVVFEFVAKSQSIELLTSVTHIFADSITKIWYFFATPKPPLFLISNLITLIIRVVFILVCLIGFDLRIDTYFHTKIEQRISFCKIHYIKLDGFIFAGVFDLKKEPLSMTISIDIILHE